MLASVSIFGFLPVDLLAGLGAAEVQAEGARAVAFQQEIDAIFSGLQEGGPEDPAGLASKLQRLEEGFAKRPVFFGRLDSIGILRDFGKRAEDQGRYAEGTEIYRRLIRWEKKAGKGPYAISWYNLGHSLYGEKKFEEAADAFRKSIEIQSHPRAWCALAKALNRLKRWDEALKAIDQSAAVGGGNAPQTSLVRGLILRSQGHLEEGVECFRRAIRLEEGRFAKTYVELGISLRDLGRCEESLKAMNYAIDLEPDLGFAYIERGLTLYAMDRFEEALRDFDEGAKFRNMNPYELSIKAAALRSLDRAEEAIPILEELTRVPPPRGGVYNMLGICYRHQKRFEDSLAALNRAIELEPTHAKNWLERAITQKLLLHLDEALSDVEKAIELEEGLFPFSFCEKSSILCYMRRFNEALEVLLKIENRFPDSDEIWFYKGMALIGLERLEEALADFVKASEISPNRHEAVFHQAAEVLIQLKRYEEAWDVLNHLLTISKERIWGEIYLNQAMVLYYWERYNEALEKVNAAQTAGAGLNRVTEWRSRILVAINRRRRAAAS